MGEQDKQTGRIEEEKEAEFLDAVREQDEQTGRTEKSIDISLHILLSSLRKIDNHIGGNYLGKGGTSTSRYRKY